MPKNSTIEFLKSADGKEFVEALLSLANAVKGVQKFFEGAIPEVSNFIAAENGESGKTKKRKKVAKDPNAPKHPLSSYMLFNVEHRRVLKQQHPEMEPKQIVSELGRLWREMSEEDKEVYTETARGLKEEYDIELKQYKESLANIQLPSGSDSESDSSSSDDESEEPQPKKSKSESLEKSVKKTLQEIAKKVGKEAPSKIEKPAVVAKAKMTTPKPTTPVKPVVMEDSTPKGDKKKSKKKKAEKKSPQK